MPKITSDLCKQAIVDKLTPMMALPEFPERTCSLPFDEGDYFDDYPENRAYALVAKHWKRYEKKSFAPGQESHSDQYGLYPRRVDDPDTYNALGFSVMPDMTKPYYDPAAGTITMRWFQCYGPQDSEDETPDPRLHARVYEQNNQIVHIWLYSEG